MRETNADYDSDPEKTVGSETCDIPCVHPESVKAVREGLPSERMREELADFFRNFGDTTRLTIIAALLPGELCVCDIASVLGMSTSAVSHQLRVLRQSRIVRSRREGKQIFYSIDDHHIGSVVSLARIHLEEEHR